MRVMCIAAPANVCPKATRFRTGQGIPQIEAFQTYTVIDTNARAADGTIGYELAELPGLWYAKHLFIPLSELCEVQILHERGQQSFFN